MNSELLAWNLMSIYRVHPDSMYTFLTHNNRILYESRNFENLLAAAPFLLIGEHKVLEKLRLSERIKLNKKQREWIAEPAKGAVLMTKLAEYQLIQEEKEENGNG